MRPSATAGSDGRINWALVGPLIGVVALLVSMLLLQGQTHTRIDATRVELRTAIDANRAELLSEIRTLREDVGSLASPDLSGIQDELASIKTLLEQTATER